MSNLSLEILEKYVLSDNKEKTRILDDITPYTEEFYFVELILEIYSRAPLV